MEKKQLRILSNAIFEAQTWKPGRSPLALENDFYQLMLSGPPLDAQTELWLEFRRSLAENPHLDDKEIREFLSRPDFARQGYWWFDPDQWKS